MAVSAPAPTRAEFLTATHAAGNVALILGAHALLAAWFVLGYAGLPFALFAPLTVVASVVHQKAMSEWIHEGGHFNVVASRRWNDRLTNALAGIWFGITADAYRSTHFPHHARRGFFVDDDPDTSFLTITSRRELHRAVARDLLGLTTARQFLRFGSSHKPSSERKAFMAVAAVFHLALVAVLFSVGRLDAYVLYYGTLVFVYPLHNRLRVYGQHVTVDEEGRALVVSSGTSRTIDGGFLDRVLWTSPRLLYHFEHHRQPHLPWRAHAGLCAHAGDENTYTRRRYGVLRDIYLGLDRED